MVEDSLILSSGQYSFYCEVFNDRMTKIITVYRNHSNEKRLHMISSIEFGDEAIQWITDFLKINHDTLVSYTIK